MLTFRQIQQCEGYYYNLQTGEIIRNVGPGENRCWRESSWRESKLPAEMDRPQFELLTTDVLMPFEAIQRKAADRHRRYGRTVGIVILPDGRSLNEELVYQGLAWWYRRYSKSPELASSEMEARSAQRR